MKNKLSCIGIFLLIILLTSCSINNRFLRADAIGFNQKVSTSYVSNRGIFSGLSSQSSPCNLLDQKGSVDNAAKNKFQEYLTNTPRGEMTASDYAMVLAAKRINYVRRKVAKNDPNTKYYIFLLSDGTDNYSPEAAKQEHDILFPRTADKYAERVQKKLKGAMGPFAKNEFEVYPMIYLGWDMLETKQNGNMSEEQFAKFINENMKHYRFSSIGDAPQVIQASDYEKIIIELRKKFISSSYSFLVPTSYAGKQIKMSFENRRGVPATLIGTLKKQAFGYVLTDIKVDGITISKNTKNFSKDGKTLKPSWTSDGKVCFSLENLRYGNNEPYFPNNDKVKQEYQNRGFWTINSEYKEDTSMDRDTYFIIVMDGSRSLDGKNNEQNGFEQELKLANEIVDMILDPRKGQK